MPRPFVRRASSSVLLLAPHTAQSQTVDNQKLIRFTVQGLGLGILLWATGLIGHVLPCCALPYRQADAQFEQLEVLARNTQ